jgi:hypothetical protein
MFLPFKTKDLSGFKKSPQKEETANNIIYEAACLLLCRKQMNRGTIVLHFFS